jgi:hypothetical protein
VLSPCAHPTTQQNKKSPEARQQRTSGLEFLA